MTKTDLLRASVIQYTRMETLTRLRDELRELEEQLNEVTYCWHHRGNEHHVAKYLKNYQSRILKKEVEIAMFLAVADLVGRICIQNNLPGGDPCWISEMIMRSV